MSTTQLSKLLPLPNENLQQALDYAANLSKDEAVEYLNDLLGDSPEALEFITTFNSQRQRSKGYISSKSSNSVRDKSKKNIKPLHVLTTNKELSDFSTKGTPYLKEDEHDYVIPAKKHYPDGNKNTVSLAISQPHVPPSAAGPLISDFTNKRLKIKSVATKNSNKTTSLKPINKTKFSISGGKALHGASTTISEIDAAIRSLEISNNSKQLELQASSRRICNCIGTRHPILEVTPNCLSCGKVICIIEGLGPCTFCGVPLLSPTEIKTMISHLREERGREKMLADSRSQKHAEDVSVPKRLTSAKKHISSYPSLPDDTSIAKLEAQAHRDKLLDFQAQNARRATVRDEVAEFNTDEAEVKRDMLWATPAEKAQALKRQQKLLKEMEWRATPKYQQKNVVVSLDVVKGKVMKQIRVVEPMAEAENFMDEKSRNLNLHENNELEKVSNQSMPSTFGTNPLMGNLIRPIWTEKVNRSSQGVTIANENESRHDFNHLRRVQDDQRDNENIILNCFFSNQ